MRTHKELATAAAATILIMDTLAARSGTPPNERLKLAAETIEDVLRLAQEELLASQRETSEALAAALNVAGGK